MHTNVTLLIFTSSCPSLTIKSCSVFNSLSDKNTLWIGIQYIEGLSIHKNMFVMILVALSFIPVISSLFVPFARTAAIVFGSMRMFVLFINLASSHSTKKTEGSFEGHGLE